MFDSRRDTMYGDSFVSIAEDTTVAVLPFRNLSADKSFDHLCIGFTLDLITDLSRFRAFSLISWHSSQLLKPDEERDSVRMSQLHAHYLIKGTFRHDRGRIRINAQLIRTSDDRIIWADHFENKPESIFSIHEDVVRQIVVSLQHQVNADILVACARKPAANFNAYTYWLLGFSELKKGTSESDMHARNFFQRAIEIDPEYSRAYTGMSLSYFNEWSCQIWDRWEVSQKGAFDYAKKAIQLDDQDYFSTMVLGRVHMYETNFDTAEYYFRKSLNLNPNDADNLVQIATYFVMLGYADEALHLYERAMKLNPLGNEAYTAYGAFILFELGEYDRAIKLVQLHGDEPTWIDMPVYIAAAWYMLGDHEKAKYYWQKFMRLFTERISHGKPTDVGDAISWLVRINPYRGKSNVYPFWEFVKQEDRAFSYPINTPAMAAAREHPPVGDAPVSYGEIPSSSFDSDSSRVTEVSITNSFSEEGGIWKLAFDGKEVLFPTAKGFSDIRKLLISPDTALHCSVLMGTTPRDEVKHTVFDEKAKKEYQKKIQSLREQMDMAAENRRESELKALQDEYDHLIRHLSSSLGLKGTIRQTGDVSERIRSAVTWRIRNSIRLIDKKHPALAKHLAVSIKTGRFCSYSPEKPVSWSL